MIGVDEFKHGNKPRHTDRKAARDNIGTAARLAVLIEETIGGSRRGRRLASVIGVYKRICGAVVEERGWKIFKKIRGRGWWTLVRDPRVIVKA